MAERRVTCHGCAVAFAYEDVLSRSAQCEKCGAELRCCLNCRFYDAAAYNDCSEPSAERVLDKGRANFCDYFSPSEGAADARGSSSAALADLEGMFKKK